MAIRPDNFYGLLMAWSIAATVGGYFISTCAASFGMLPERPKRIDDQSGELGPYRTPFIFLIFATLCVGVVGLLSSATAVALGNRIGGGVFAVFSVLLAWFLYICSKASLFKWDEKYIERPGTAARIAWSDIKSLDWNRGNAMSARGPQSTWITWRDCNGAREFVKILKQKRPDLFDL